MPLPDDATDQQLISDYAAGGMRAFEMLYDRHQQRLWRYLFRSVGDAATADDLTQEVWLRVASQAERYQPRAGTAERPAARFTTWLFTIARNRVVDYLRAQRPGVSLDEPVNESHTIADTLAAPFDETPLRRVENQQQAGQLLAALSALPAEQREAFLLQAEGEMSVAEIAVATGVGLETAKSRLRYARVALRRALEDIV